MSSAWADEIIDLLSWDQSIADSLSKGKEAVKNVEQCYSYKHSGSILLYAIDKGKRDSVQQMLEAGCDVNVQHKYFEHDLKPLEYAVTDGKADCIDLLLEWTKNPDLKALEELALSKGHYEVAYKICKAPSSHAIDSAISRSKAEIRKKRLKTLELEEARDVFDNIRELREAIAELEKKTADKKAVVKELIESDKYRDEVAMNKIEDEIAKIERLERRFEELKEEEGEKMEKKGESGGGGAEPEVTTASEAEENPSV